MVIVISVAELGGVAPGGTSSERIFMGLLLVILTLYCVLQQATYVYRFIRYIYLYFVHSDI